AATLCAGPVCFELATVQIGPLRHELERASRQITDQHLAATDRDHRVVLGVLGMEMGRFVIVEVHRDRDAVEEADPGHLAIMAGAWDGLVESAPFQSRPAVEGLPSCTYGESQARTTQAASRRLPAVQAAQAVVGEEGRAQAGSSRRDAP